MDANALMDMNVQTMSDGIDTIADQMDALDTLQPMLTNIQGMNVAINSMAQNTGQMTHDLWDLNDSISSPMQFMSGFMPWSNSRGYRPRRGFGGPQPYYRPRY